MSYNDILDASPVPAETGTSFEETLPIRSDVRIESLLLAIIDRLDGILYVMHSGILPEYSPEDDDDEIAH